MGGWYWGGWFGGGGWLLQLTCEVWEVTNLIDFNQVFSVSVKGCFLHIIETVGMIW